MMNANYNNFGEYLKANRKEKGMSASEIARLIGVSRAEISRIESGDRKEPSIKILRSTTILFGDDMSKVSDMILGGKPQVTKIKTSKKKAEA